MKPFDILENAKDSYKKYVTTFQKFKNPVIKAWVHDRIDRGSLLWRNPNIELSRRFEKGEPLESMRDQGLIHEKILEIFSVDPMEPSAEPISPYKHQSEAIRKILGDEVNTIISTGTGSGKSFCFGIPIVNDCLKMKGDGVPGIKAIIVYPMNALANSQYSDFAKRLDGTGLKIALYTGDMKNSREEALGFLEESTGRTEPYDSEVICRDEMREEPPDIVMTNYVMLEYMLMRFEDQKLFPYEHRGNLRYLVLDEIHTYTGRRGADVAALLRRVKKRTDVIGKIRCIGTSATVEAGEGEDSAELVASFARKLFGEPFEPHDVIGESYIEPVVGSGTDLPDDVLVTDELIEGFEYDIESTVPLVEALVGHDIQRPLSRGELGSILEQQKTVEFLRRELLESNRSIDDLEKRYQEEVRKNSSLKECGIELKGALLAGLVGTTEYEGKEAPLFTPKLHKFFSQGRSISSCLTLGGPHLHDKGDLVCNECRENGNERITLPLYFCRACGQEYYGASIDDDGTLMARDIDVDTDEYEDVYIYPKTSDEPLEELPDMFISSRGGIKDTYEDHVPVPRLYCPEHNAFEDEDSDCFIPDKNKLNVATLKKPFLYCPDCGAHYDRRPKEFNKLFSFGSVGRSTATDILISSLLSELDEGAQKTIVFSDNRQDTSLQASHINNFQKRIQFRRGVYRALKKVGGPTELLSLGKEVYDVLENNGVLPEYDPDPNIYAPERLKRKYIKYLKYQLVRDVMSSPQKNQQNLEDAGMIRYDYLGLDPMSKDQDHWDNKVGLPDISSLSSDARYDYLLGFLDIFRNQFALHHEFDTDFEDELSDDALVELGGPAYRKTGYSDTASNRKPGTQVMRLTSGQSRLVVWTEKVLDVDKDTAKDIVEKITDVLRSIGLLKCERIRGLGGGLYQLTDSHIMVDLIDSNKIKRCPVCSSFYHFKELDICPGKKCSDLEIMDLSEEINYFREIYAADFGDSLFLKAEEHSGQISGDERRKIEENFADKEHTLNTIVCTPTMELGIDIGELSSVHMRNVPPSPTNYSQRAGRAGRKGQPSIITTFCGVGSKRGPHEQYFYKRPHKMISGKITQPRFLMDNRSLIEAHLNSIIFEVIGSSSSGSGQFKMEGKISNILNREDEANLYPLKTSFKEKLEGKVSNEKPVIVSTFDSAFSDEIEQFSWLNDGFIDNKVDTFVDRLNDAFEHWRKEYQMLNKERHRINVKASRENLTGSEKNRRVAIEHKMNSMREGGGEFYTFRYLQNQGFLPAYGFPAASTYLVFNDRDDELVRDRKIAISEYAPGNQVYYKGSKYTIRHARPKMEDARPITRNILICPDCGNILLDDRASTSSNCPSCGKDLSTHPPNQNGMEMPDQYAVSGAKITSDEEERIRKGYDIEIGYDMGSNIEEFSLENKSSFTLTYEHNGRMIKVNKGTVGGDDEFSGFSFCTECFKWLLSPDAIDNHLPGGNKPCNRNAEEDDMIHGVILFTEGFHDVITINIPKPELDDEFDVESFYRSIKESIVQGIIIHLDLDEEEIDGLVKDDPSEEGAKTIIIYETFEGGTGALNALKNPNTLKEVFKRAREVLHEDEDDGCAIACYDCLLNYYNQREHAFLNRNVALDFLRSLEGFRMVEEGHEEHFDALMDKCESSFEKGVLKEIEKLGIELPDDAQKTIYDENNPITIADFFYSPSLAVFVDGSPHDQEYVSDMDKKKRMKIKQMGFRVYSISNMDDVKGLKGVIGR